MTGRVFVLGAGASADDTKHLELPLPLANEFFDPRYLTTHWPRDLGAFPSSALYNVLTCYFEVDWQRKVNVRINIEEVYSFVDICAGTYGARHPLDDLRLFGEARAQLLAYIEHLTRYVPWHLNEPRLHSLIANHLRPEDSLLTFNWDILSDRALSAAGQTSFLEDQKELLEPGNRVTPERGFQTDAADVQKGRFLKLHGSTNLAVCRDSQCPKNTEPFRFGLNEELLRYADCTWCGSPLEVFLVPPLVYKPYEQNRFLRLQANLAAKRLHIADEVVIIGYSFPIFDSTARAMFRLARSGPDKALLSNVRRIVVANPAVAEEAYVAALKSILGLLNARRTHGGPVELRLYATVDDLIEKESPYWSSPPDEHPVARRIHDAYFKRLLRYARKPDRPAESKR